MSHFENYSSKQKANLNSKLYTVTSKNYDDTRVPVGLDQIIKYSKVLGKPLKELNLLDCGCGSGNYLVELAKYFGTVTGIGKGKTKRNEETKIFHQRCERRNVTTNKEKN